MSKCPRTTSWSKSLLKACFSEEKKLCWGSDVGASLDEEIADASVGVPAGGPAKAPLLPPKHSTRPTPKACEKCGIRGTATKFPPAICSILVRQDSSLS